MSPEPLRIFIGYDHRQPVSYHVLSYSLAKRSSVPVSITPLMINQLPIDRMGLTPFTWTRFLVPYLCGYKGWGLFLDIDMVVLGDISELFKMKDDKYAVMAVTGDHRFEWASFMLFNCGHPDNKKLTPEYIEKTDGLHALKWTENIGSLPKEWNHIVLYDKPRKDAKLVHYTCGIPVFPETEGCEYMEEWVRDAQEMASSQNWASLMGSSVHVKRLMDFQRKRHASGG